MCGLDPAYFFLKQKTLFKAMKAIASPIFFYIAQHAFISWYPF